MMTLEQLGFVKQQLDKYRVFYKQEIFTGRYYRCIEFNLLYKEIELTNIESMDMILIEAIYTKAKELFE